MTENQKPKKAARALAMSTGQSYTRAMWALEAVLGMTVPWPILTVGQKVRFAEERASYVVEAVSRDGRFVACVKTLNIPGSDCNPSGPRKRLYSVIDMALGIRGTSTSWGTSFLDREGCQRSIEAFERGTVPWDKRKGDPAVIAEISFRNWRWLRMHPKQTDPVTATQLPWLAQVLAVAPTRDYNDVEPRSTEELMFRLRERASEASGGQDAGCRTLVTRRHLDRGQSLGGTL